MKFNSQICTTREQSERLLTLGLKKETADMRYAEYYIGDNCDGPYMQYQLDVCPPLLDQDIPAWSLHRLIELCSQQIYVGKRKYFHTLHLINNEYVAYIDDIGDAYQYHDERDLYNSLIKCIEWLIKEGYFNKEYLV